MLLVSDQSESCVHCGYPITQTSKENKICCIDGVPYDFSKVLEDRGNKYVLLLVKIFYISLITIALNDKIW